MLAEVWLSGVIWVVSVGFAAGGDPKLDVPTAPVQAGQAVAVRVRAAGGAKLWIDACEPIELEKHEGEAWTSVAGVTCPHSVAAAVVDKELTLTVPAPAAGEYRAVLTWGTSCSAGQPFVMAACKKLGAARSGPFVVEAAPVVSTPAPPNP